MTTGRNTLVKIAALAADLQPLASVTVEWRDDMPPDLAMWLRENGATSAVFPLVDGRMIEELLLNLGPVIVRGRVNREPTDDEQQHRLRLVERL